MHGRLMRILPTLLALVLAAFGLLMVAVSAPTALAVRMAEAAGITLAAIARSDGFEVFTHSSRIKADVAARGAATQGAVHVA